MNWNKIYGYLIAISIFMLVLSGAGDPPIAGRPFLISMVLLNGVFAIFCKGWRRFLAIGFVILGVLMSCRLVQLQRTSDEHMEHLKKAADNYAKTNTPVLNLSTNLTK